LLVACLWTPLEGPSLFVLLSSSINFWPSIVIMYASSFPQICYSQMLPLFQYNVSRFMKDVYQLNIVTMFWTSTCF
jgi:hypothetical protein